MPVVHVDAVVPGTRKHYVPQSGVPSMTSLPVVPTILQLPVNTRTASAENSAIPECPGQRYNSPDAKIAFELAA